MVQANIQYKYDPKTGTLIREKKAIPPGHTPYQLKQIEKEKKPPIRSIG